MKKTFFSICAAFAATMFIASCGGKTNNPSENIDTVDIEEVATAAEAETAGSDVNAAAAELVKKIDAGEQLTDEDLGVALDYAIAMTKEMVEFVKANEGSDNVDGLLDIMKKYEYSEQIDKVVTDLNPKDIKDEAIQQKWAEYMKLLQEME